MVNIFEFTNAFYHSNDYYTYIYKYIYISISIYESNLGFSEKFECLKNLDFFVLILICTQKLKKKKE